MTTSHRAAAQHHRVAAAKLSVPGLRQHAVPRQALLDRLNQGSEAAAVTLVCAPAGFGKTTLVSAWLRGLQPQQRAAWLSLEESDHDGARFMRGVVAALQALLPGMGSAALMGQSGLYPSLLVDAMAALCEELERLPQDSRILLVLDDYQSVSSPDIDAAVVYLVDHMPAPLRLVVVSRDAPAFPLGRWRVAGRVAELDERDLRFSTAEATQFLRVSMSLALADADVRLLDVRTEGWIAGLQFAALSLRQQPAGTLAGPRLDAGGFGGRNRLVADYLSAEVLSAQPDEVRQFLCKTSVLGRFSRPLCEAVTGNPLCGDIIARLERTHMFLVPLDDDRQWFRYHQLFADFLAQDLSPESVRGLHRLASLWYEGEHLLDDALRHARLACDARATVRLLHRHAEELLCRGETRILLQALKALPDNVLMADAYLASLMAWMLNLFGRSSEAVKYQSRGYPRDEVPDARQQARIKVFEAYFALNWGDVTVAAALARQALALLGEESPYFRVLAMSYLGQSQAAIGDRSGAIATLRGAFYLGESMGNPMAAMGALPHIATLLCNQGRLLEGVELCTQAIEKYRDFSSTPQSFMGPAHVALGMLLYELGDLDRASTCMETADKLTADSGLMWVRLVGLCGLARLHHARGLKDEAWRTVARARELTESGDGPRRRRLVERLIFELHIKEGRHEAAARVYTEAIPADKRTECETLMQGYLLLAQRNPEAALALVQPLEAAARRDSFDGSRVKVLVLSALCHKAAGRLRDAAQLMERAVTIAAPAGLRRAFLDGGAAALQLMEGARPWAPEFVDSICHRDRPVGLPDSSHGSSGIYYLTDPLTQREVMLLRLMSQGLQNKEIAESLSITLGTTKQYVNRLFSKLGARNRVEAVRAAQGLKVLA